MIVYAKYKENRTVGHWEICCTAYTSSNKASKVNSSKLKETNNIINSRSSRLLIIGGLIENHGTDADNVSNVKSRCAFHLRLMHRFMGLIHF